MRELEICAMSMRLCCYDLVGVDSKTLDPFIFIIFVYVFSCGIQYRILAVLNAQGPLFIG
jgi:hypothetical protein